MKTAVEWLVEQLSKKTKDLKMELHVHCGEILEQAKEMEKEQIMDAWKDGVIRDSGTLYADEYYNETFKSE